MLVHMYSLQTTTHMAFTYKAPKFTYTQNLNFTTILLSPLHFRLHMWLDALSSNNITRPTSASSYYHGNATGRHGMDLRQPSHPPKPTFPRRAPSKTRLHPDQRLCRRSRQRNLYKTPGSDVSSKETHQGLEYEAAVKAGPWC